MRVGSAKESPPPPAVLVSPPVKSQRPLRGVRCDHQETALFGDLLKTGQQWLLLGVGTVREK